MTSCIQRRDGKHDVAFIGLRAKGGESGPDAEGRL